MNILFIPHAGGSASGYISFKKFLDPSINCVAVDLSGHGRRMKEPLLDRIEYYADDIFENYKDVFKDGDYTIFGHSMGTMLTYELNRIILKNGYPSPRHVFVSGRTAPCCSTKTDICVDLATNLELLTFFMDDKQARNPMFDNKDFVDMMGNILRSDLKSVSRYNIKKPKCSFECDITVLYGKSDALLKKPEEIDMWHEFTEKSCTIQSFEGGHFYYATQKDTVAKLINETLLTKE